MIALLTLGILFVLFGLMSDDGWPGVMLGVSLLMVALVIHLNGALT